MIRKGYVDTQEGQIHFRRCESGAGAPLVFFHMTAASSAAYEGIMLQLEGKIPVIAFDTMNYGESYRTTREPTIAYMADVLLEALANLGVKQFHTFGHHTGVSIQAEMAVRAPERVLSTIMNGPTYAPLEVLAQFKDRLARPNPINIKGTQFMWAWSRIKDNAVLPFGLDAPHLADIMNRDTIDMLRAGENWHWGYRAVFTHDLIATMDRIRCPIFLVCGRNDLSFPLHEAAAAAFPHAPTYVNDEGGVYYAESHPADLAPQIERFIAGISQK